MLLFSRNSWVIRSYLFVVVSLFVASLIVDKGVDVLWINGHHNQILDLFFSTITNLGDGLIFIPLLLICLLVQFRYAVATVLIALLNGFLVSIFKRVLFPSLGRPRKFLNDELIHFVSGIDVHSAHSFPSGHTATAFSAALLVTLLTRNKTIGLISLSFAFLVGYSRIYLAQHFLTDVAAGAVVGCFTTYMGWQMLDHNALPEWMNGKLSINRFLNKTNRGTAFKGTS